LTDLSEIVTRLSDHWKNKFGKKVYKLNFHGDFTCPNLDGTIGHEGCVYCNMKSLEPLLDLEADSKVEDHMNYLRERNGAEAFIAYFQDYSSTYTSHKVKNKLKYLEVLYKNAVSNSGIVGIAVSSRPDTIGEEILDLLKSLETDVTVEMGLQTINEKDLEWIGRGHTVRQFTEAVDLVSSYGFESVAHIILGLPNENDDKIIELARFLNGSKTTGLKIHQLMVLKNTRLEKLYHEGSAPKILAEEEYFHRLGLLLSHLNKDTVIHRLYADAPEKDLIAPLWCINKTGIQDKVFKYLIKNNLVQGCAL